MEKKNYHEPAFEIYDVSSSKILSGSSGSVEDPDLGGEADSGSGA